MGQNWLPVNELTTAIDKFVAACADGAKPKVFVLGQNPCSPRGQHEFASSDKLDSPSPKVESMG